MRVRVGHSPDPDDAFMAWALQEGVVRDEGFEVELVPQDIETLNRWAVEEARLEATALSAAAFARAADRYWLLPHGASFGDGYGPVVVSRGPLAPADLRKAAVATPGELTSATAALRMAVPDVACVHLPFDEILPAVKAGRFDAGLLIHEGQLTWAREGLHRVLDLGAWWKEETGLPLPLGLTALRKDVGPEAGSRLNALLRASIEAGLRHRREALAYARRFGRGIPLDDADRFVAMYVNDLTRDMGARGLEAVRAFLARAAQAGAVPRGFTLDVAPGP